MINKMILTGPCYISKFDEPGKKGCEFRIAQKPWKDAETEYLPCVAYDSEYRQLATQVREKFSEKGAPIEIEGRFRSREYEGRDGEKKVKVYLDVEKVTWPPKVWTENYDSSGDDKGESGDSLLPF
mgnify:CR=1 FL=1